MPDNVILKNMDCFEFIKEIRDDSVDLILIDPPYNISRNSNFASGEPTGKDTDRFRVSMDFGEWDSRFEHEILDNLFKEFHRVLKRGGTVICFYDLWKISYLKESLEMAKFKQIRFIEWLKTNPVPLNSKTNYLTNSREIALTAVKVGKPTFHSEYDNGIYSFPICQDKGRFHPTQKPLKLIMSLIEKHSNKDDLVLDCFSGSGTTAAACVELKRKFIGCELDKNYFERSLKRLKEVSIEYENWRYKRYLR